MGLTVSKEEFLETTLSAAHASISVLLVLGYGVAAEHFGILTPEGEKNMAYLGVTVFLPALLFSEIGPEATVPNLISYWIIIVLAVWFQLLSYVAAITLRKVFKLPSWVVPCLIFNNVTSLPLLMAASLESHGAFDVLLRKGETIDDISRRVQNYILVNALVCNLARFVFGPMLMSVKDDIHHPFTHHESPHLLRHEAESDDAPQEISVQHDDPERQPLLETSSSAEVSSSGRKKKNAQSLLYRAWRGVKSFVNPPLIGGAVAIIVGAVPFLHDLILSEDAPLAVLTESIRTIGGVYTAMQIFVLGGQLYAKRGVKSDPAALLVILIWRFLAMPALSITTVYFLRKLTYPGVVRTDPALDYVLAMAPVGPPAITLAAIADMSDVSPETEGCIDRTLMYSYMTTPLISMAILGALAVVMKLHGH